MITLENVDEVLEECGFLPQKPAYPRGNWHRVFLQVPQSNSSVPLSLGRLMFYEYELSHTKWYCEPSGDLRPEDFYYFSLLHYKTCGVPLDAPAWSELVHECRLLSQIDREEKRAARRDLPPRKRKAIQGCPPASFAHQLLRERATPTANLRYSDFPRVRLLRKVDETHYLVEIRGEQRVYHWTSLEMR